MKLLERPSCLGPAARRAAREVADEGRLVERQARMGRPSAPDDLGQARLEGGIRLRCAAFGRQFLAERDCQFHGAHVITASPRRPIS